MTTTMISNRRFIIALVALMLAGANLYAVKTFDVFGLPVLFAASVLGEIILIVTAAFYLVMGLAVRENVVKSLAQSAWHGINGDPNIKRLRRTKSRFLRFLARRFETLKPTGLPLTVVLVIAGYFLYHFLGVLLGIVHQGPEVQIDLRVLNLMPTIRTDLQTACFMFVTFLANVESVIYVTLLTAGLLLVRRERLWAAIIVAAAAATEAITYILKHLVDRARPAEALRLLHEQGGSFPSGHVMRATVLFGLIAYLLFKSSKSTFAKLVIVVGYITTVFMVALSRVYLGVHYPSDVTASALLGASLLTLVIGGIEIGTRYRLPQFRKLRFEHRQLWAVPVALAGFALVLGPAMLHERTLAAPDTTIPVAAIDNSTVRRLPLYSETPTGTRMEPIGFIYAGSEAQIVSAFLNHGWFRADASTLSNTLKAVSVGFQGGQYETAPVTPSYLNAKPENLAFEKPTETNSLRQRHHTRIWKTDFALEDGRRIWVATASYDVGVQLAGPAKLPTHHIDPNIDGERAYIVESLGTAATYIEVVKPQLGKNASGDEFFTDGRAAIIAF